MKKMTTNIKSLAALLMASATFAACSSDDANSIADQPVQQPAGQQVYTMTVNASKGGDAATSRALALDGTTLNATWATTENIYVKKGDTWATGSLKPQSDGTTATLKGSLSGITIAAGDNLTLQFPKSGDISYDGQVGTLEDIAANFDYATATVTVESVSDEGNINPTAATTTFTNQQAIVKFTLKNGDDALSATKLVVAVGSTEYEVNPESAASEIYVAIPGFSGQTVTLTATVGSDTYTYEKSGVTFENGKYYAITVKMTAQASTPTGALSGKFTINSSGDKVYFSKGNLQAKIASYASNSATASEWKFADSQYSTIGNAAGNTTFATGTWVDLFSWVGNSATNDTYGLITFTSSSQANHGNVSGESLKTDWGTAAASSIGTGWRTLSKDEWVYLFNTRTVNNGTGSGRSYTLGQKVNNVLGVVLYPDDYTGSTYSGSNWADFENAGCVFLPAAGYRYGTSVYNVGSLGRFWSSTAYGSVLAYSVNFDSGYVYPANYSYRYYGFSVRLVRPVE